MDYYTCTNFLTSGRICLCYYKSGVQLAGVFCLRFPLCYFVGLGRFQLLSSTTFLSVKKQWSHSKFQTTGQKLSWYAFLQFLGQAEELLYRMESQPSGYSWLGMGPKDQERQQKKCAGNGFWRTVSNLCWGFPEALPCWVLLLCVWGVTSALCRSAPWLWPGKLPDLLKTPTKKMNEQLLISLWPDFTRCLGDI